MSFQNGYNALNAYKQVRNVGVVDRLSPGRLIQMLMQGALEGIAIAKGHMLRGEIARKGEQISRVIGILDGLRASLNLEAGGELAQNLDRLYDYMERRLLHGNVHTDSAALDEVTRLLGEIKGAWETITAAGTATGLEAGGQPSVSAGAR
jgi:flagellar protein FliS